MFRSIVLAFAATLLGALAGACALDARGPFDDVGLAHGAWCVVYCDGAESSGAFRHGDRRDGRWLYGYPDGSPVFGAYRAELLDGVWTMRDVHGTAVERECGIGMGDAGLCAE